MDELDEAGRLAWAAISSTRTPWPNSAGPAQRTWTLCPKSRSSPGGSTMQRRRCSTFTHLRIWRFEVAASLLVSWPRGMPRTLRSIAGHVRQRTSNDCARFRQPVLRAAFNVGLARTRFHRFPVQCRNSCSVTLQDSPGRCSTPGRRNVGQGRAVRCDPALASPQLVSGAQYVPANSEPLRIGPPAPPWR